MDVFMISETDEDVFNGLIDDYAGKCWKIIYESFRVTRLEFGVRYSVIVES